MRWLLLLLLLSVAVPAAAVPATLAVPVTSMDRWIDAQLVDLDRYAARYPAAFDDELMRYQDAPRDLITQLRQSGWPHSRIYAACAIAKTTGRPCRVVADAWTGEPGQPWDAVASRFGVAAESSALQRLKAAITATYDRWGRPLAALPPT